MNSSGQAKIAVYPRVDLLRRLRLLKAPTAPLLVTTGNLNRDAASLATPLPPTHHLPSAPRVGTGALTFGAASPSPPNLPPLPVIHLPIPTQEVLAVLVEITEDLEDPVVIMEDPVARVETMEDLEALVVITGALETDTTGVRLNHALLSAPLDWTPALSQASAVTTSAWTLQPSLSLAVAAQL
jgi:hypothetical protein